ncbi:MAG: hypothetical protein WAQ27_05135 [Candidatus Microsaccharimonas sp.]
MIKTNMEKTINLAPIIFIAAIATGVLVHDMRIDKAASVALALPAVLATYGAAHFVGSGSEHIHVERVAFSNQSSIYHSSLPKITPRDDDKRYVQSKKSITTSGDNTSLWPSI